MNLMCFRENTQTDGRKEGSSGLVYYIIHQEQLGRITHLGGLLDFLAGTVFPWYGKKGMLGGTVIGF
jgi:hypothetical protein